MQIDRENIDRLPSLVSEIHDMWFSVEEIVFDQSKHEFRLYFGREKGLYDRCLKVEGVLKCEIKDTEKVVVYDIYELSVDLQKSKISITGCIPIRIVLHVSEDFEMSIAPA